VNLPKTCPRTLKFRSDAACEVCDAVGVRRARPIVPYATEWDTYCTVHEEDVVERAAVAMEFKGDEYLDLRRMR